ncbi:MAG TPA: VIT1/CCC1 transporter family protein [Thermoplasmata archaeon]|nr:VIT1/CCC1 transporter family protein [Thermoplasmata archaeon]
MDVRRWRQRVSDYAEITNVGPIIRRYFVIGAFDGALTILGVIIGAYAAGAAEDHKPLILAASISAGIGLAVSSAVGAYEAERVEKKLDQYNLERAMLSKMSEEHREAFRFAAVASALVHGVAPLIAGILPVIPFLFLEIGPATAAAIFVTLTILFAIGAYLGRLVRDRFFFTALRFVAAGIGTAVLLWLLGPLAAA